MNKILIALVLAVVMSGNAYANFITDAFKSEQQSERKFIPCLEIVEKGRLIHTVEDSSKSHGHRIYVYKGHTAKYWYLMNICTKE